MMIVKNKTIFYGILLCTLFLLTTSILLYNQYTEWNKAKVTNTDHRIESHAVRSSSVQSKQYEMRATIAGIGDILIHHTLYEDAYDGSNYNFKPMFQSIESSLQKPDFLIANQESMPGGVELGLSSYPMFNSPKEIVMTLQQVGVDAITNANNHTLDQGIRGVESSIKFYEKIGMPYTGAFKSLDDQQSIRTFNVNGIRFALLSYTYGTNGIPIPEGKEYVVNLLDKNQMIEDIQKAKKLDIDLVVLGVHWGNEYQRYPTDEQKSLARSLTEAGADIIFGHHPHVLQPIEKHTLPDGREAVVIYSLGNFLSGQKDDYKDIGGIATVEVVKTLTDKGTVIHYPSVTFEPTFVSEQRYRNYLIHPLQEAFSKGLTPYTEEQLVSHMFSPLQ